MDIILNQIAIWQPCGSKELNIRKSPSGQQYLEPNGVVYKNSIKPLIRYAKDYEVKKVKFSLFLRTDCEDEAKVEAALDYYAAQVTKKEALEATSTASMSNFTYTPYIFSETLKIAQEGE